MDKSSPAQGRLRHQEFEERRKGLSTSSIHGHPKAKFAEHTKNLGNKRKVGHIRENLRPLEGRSTTL